MPDKYLLKTLKKLNLTEPLRKLETAAYRSGASPTDFGTAQALKHARYDAEAATLETRKSEAVVQQTGESATNDKYITSRLRDCRRMGKRAQAHLYSVRHNINAERWGMALGYLSQSLGYAALQRDMLRELVADIEDPHHDQDFSAASINEYRNTVQEMEDECQARLAMVQHLAAFCIVERDKYMRAGSYGRT